MGQFIELLEFDARKLGHSLARRLSSGVKSKVDYTYTPVVKLTYIYVSGIRDIQIGREVRLIGA